jgi:predicted DsbA family dithiol-disulfide isomerase
LDYEINQDILEARNNGVSGVPFFVLNGKYAVSERNLSNFLKMLFSKLIMKR